MACRQGTLRAHAAERSDKRMKEAPDRNSTHLAGEYSWFFPQFREGPCRLPWRAGRRSRWSLAEEIGMNR